MGYSIYRSAALLALSIVLQSGSFLSIKLATLAGEWPMVMLIGLAFTFLGARAYVWQRLLKTKPLSLVYPFASLVQVLLLLYAVIFFGEHIQAHQLLGFLFMLAGLTVIAMERIK